jgi:uncharacterized protein (TIGR04255 family)
MLFPESERVIYRKNPLEQVICQLRFPPILRIDAEVPAAFQDKIRNDYPLLNQRSETAVQLPKEIIREIPPDVINAFFASTNRAYDFISEDKLWVVSLTRDFLALATHKYVRWEEFRNHLEKSFQALITEYSPSFFSRIGLRYQNLINRKKLGLGNVPWADLLNTHIAGELASREKNIADSIQEVVSQVVMQLPDSLGKVRITHGLFIDKGGETCYLIDNDFFAEPKMEISDAINRLDTFNEQNRYLFRWAVSDKLHEAMEPTPV